MFYLESIPSVFCDSYLSDNNGDLVFSSFWGRDIQIQELISRLTIKGDDLTITELVLISQDESNTKHIGINCLNSLNKDSIRVSNTCFGNIVNVCIYTNDVTSLDLKNSRTWILYRTDHKEPEIWNRIKSVCHLPLLDSWKDPVIKLFIDNGWIFSLEGVGVCGIRIDLSQQEEVENVIRDNIIRNVLTVV